MNACPDCGRDVWLYDANTWTCKSGHRTPFDPRAAALIPPTVHTVHPLAVIGLIAGIDVIVDLLIRLIT